MWVFYVFAALPIMVGFGLWLYNPEKISWKEWLIGSGIALLLALIFQFLSVVGMTSDIETWSGQIDRAVWYPEWVEEYLESHTICTGSGKDETCTTYYTTEYRTHPEYWTAITTLGAENEITHDFYWTIRWYFVQNEWPATEWAYKSGFYSGDHNIYVVYNKSKFIYPVTETRRWTNKIKACPSVFSYPKIREPQKVGIYEYPKNENWLRSDRILGTGSVSIDEWDRLNARTGPLKKVNLILVWLPQDALQAKYQEAYWIGGKKNDLVLCYGGNTKDKTKATWSRVFGWTEQEIVKRNLETILLNNPIDNTIISKIEQEVKANYIIKDWKKFDYLKIEPPTWSYIVYFIVMILVQSAFWWCAEEEVFTDDY